MTLQRSFNGDETPYDVTARTSSVGIMMLTDDEDLVRGYRLRFHRVDSGETLTNSYTGAEFSSRGPELAKDYV